ncbi:hypothetical protein LA20533_00135 [Amylolactobacillus amylophilus DSM 20533 = JCM 1125]|uniref:Uncharacterized protein n=1 Tax=Amylolactobacillus amylophilus DSM 20533 = JCM 1125 TaxID=1423721 RepID=A0A1L6XA24_9LACO|nr:hypothetical protein LA20533_00135 [Amylolactobacillus amylophilus DSM 20533 = JCM 1125]
MTLSRTLIQVYLGHFQLAMLFPLTGTLTQLVTELARQFLVNQDVNLTLNNDLISSYYLLAIRFASSSTIFMMYFMFVNAVLINRQLRKQFFQHHTVQNIIFLLLSFLLIYTLLTPVIYQVPLEMHDIAHFICVLLGIIVSSILLLILRKRGIHNHERAMGNNAHAY